MPRSNEDEAWRAIVDNYGDRVELGPDEAPDQGPEQASVADPPADPPADPFAVPAELSVVFEEERFVPPPPPPLPHVPRDRMLAWVGLFGSPAILLTALVLGIGLPPLVGYLLVAAFLSGFAYLVAQMPRGPHDPYDDGARL